MDTIQAIILGIVQGLTEFLPISSSAHLVIVPDLMGWEPHSISFDLVLHLGSLVSVVIYFWRDLMGIVKGFVRLDSAGRPQRRLGALIIIGTVPAALIGGLFQDKFEEIFGSPSKVAALLLVTGVLLISSEAVARRRRQIDELKVSDTGIIGLAQAVAIAPGISRSGATISMGLFLGFTREAAARFSFLLSIPIIAGATLVKLRHGMGDSPEGQTALILGFLAAALSGFAAIRFLLGYVRRHNLRIFALYCWVVGVGVLLWHLVV